ncbi:DNA-directed DNA polymerase [Synchytrium microbalum]|uniref:DNA-directed DNA polymerase n=1 Tax=Synchytrium microbalum TaxID=1806994 RepID=A0A507BPR8_9FUNG|nr:DNA-directed DNA polymerase [Synchytrium microbalum]TPX31930.1 DNA-directed DNA polymerase [Synchytrium microbalum]
MPVERANFGMFAVTGFAPNFAQTEDNIHFDEGRMQEEEEPSYKERIIIHIDIDCFYAQTEEIARPELKLLPLAIQQKHIVVTCNYEARKYGVGKLELLTEALKKCPQLVVVSGEDISRYRRSSRHIFDLVNVAVNGNSSLPRVNVERLGFDELFIDVTDIVSAHLDQAGMDIPIGSIIQLDLFPDLESIVDENDWSPMYLRYQYGTFEGNVVGVQPQQSLDRQHLLLATASHLARHLRHVIYRRLKYTCSSGVSVNKLLSKIVGTKLKPDGQSVLMPSETSTFMNGVSLRKVTGIGRKTGAEIVNYIATVRPEWDGEKDEWGHPKKMPTCVELLEIADLKQWSSWFGDALGKKIDGLLRGIDPSPVIPTGLSQQISVEDSFQHCNTTADARTRLIELATSWLERVQEEEYVETDNSSFLNLLLYGAALDKQQENPSQWRRHATTLRLTIRLRKPGERGWSGDRESKATALPVDVFDTTISIPDRAQALADRHLVPLLSKMVQSRPQWDMTLLNISCSDFKLGPPQKSISNFFRSDDGKGMVASSGSSGSNDTPPKSPPSKADILKRLGIDPSVFEELPIDVQDDILQEAQQPLNSKPVNNSTSNTTSSSKRKSESNTTKKPNKVRTLDAFWTSK